MTSARDPGSAMDSPRPLRRVGLRAPLLGVVVLGFAMLALWFITSTPAAPVLTRSSIIIDTVVRRDLVKDVRAPGTLAPTNVHYLTAQTSARVERLVAESGARVRAGEVVLVLSNPDVLTQSLEAEQRVRSAQSDLANLRSTLQLQALAQEGIVASVTTQAASAAEGERVSDTLARYRYVSQVESATATNFAREMSTRLRVERERLAVMREAVAEQINAKRAQITQLQAIAANQRARLQSLEVRAPSAGILQDFELQLGQWVPEGATLARIIEPGLLKAILRVAETEATAVRPGQTAVVDLRNGTITGRVARKSTGAFNGTIPVDIELPRALPGGAVPDLNIDGTIQLDVLPNVLTIGRPALSSPNAVVNLYRLTADGTAAVRVQVQLGAITATRAEVRAGLAAGDRVIVSDMSSYSTVERVRLK
jgi:HlyD family secretion protein